LRRQETRATSCVVTGILLWIYFLKRHLFRVTTSSCYQRDRSSACHGGRWVTRPRMENLQASSQTVFLVRFRLQLLLQLQLKSWQTACLF
jgi:hypothetical protein